jgi:NarL family two-component system response regulator LiaR
MTSEMNTARELAKLLVQHQDEIVTAWAKMARQLPDYRSRKRPSEDLETTSRSILESLIKALATGFCPDPEDRLTEGALDRLRMGFDAGEIVEFILLIKEAALPFILRAILPDSPGAYQAIARLDASVRRLMGQYGHLYDQLAQRHLQEQQHRTTLMLRAVHTASRRSELDQILKQIVEGIKAAVGVKDCAAFLLNPEGGLIHRVGTGDLIRERYPALGSRPINPAGHGFFREVLEGRKPAICHDAQTDPRANREAAQLLGIKSVVGVPMEVGGRTLGVVLVATFDEHHTFTLEEVELVWGIAHLVALTLENARLYDQMQQQLTESQSLQRVTAALLQELSLEEVLEIVCIEARRLTAAAESVVCVLDGDQERCLHAILGRAETSPSFEHVPLAQCITELLTRTGEPLLSNDPSPGLGCYCAESELTSVLAVPLRARDAISGALSVMNKPGGFTTEDLHLIGLFADQAAIAIENARLYRQVGQLAAAEERQRLARELHDSVTHDLYSITLYAEAAARLLDAGNVGAVAEQLREVRDTGREALREMRQLIFELRPPVLEKEGLVAALRARLEAVEARAGFQTELRVTGEKRLPPALEEELFRIVQETLNNVVKHARATRVTLNLHLGEQVVSLEVGDDGVGFDPIAARQRGGLGLEGIEERLQGIGGKLQVESAPGRGTRVRVEAAIGRVLPEKAEQPALPRMLILPGPGLRSQPLAPIRVLIADDHTIVRQGIRALLATQAGIEVVGEAANGLETVDRVEELHPDVVLMDLLMPVMDGIEATRRITARQPQVRILVLTSFASDEKVFPAIQAGALGYLLKDSEPEDLVQAIHNVYRGQSSLHPLIARKALRELARPSERLPAPDVLTQREREVLRLLGRGSSNAQIAEELVIAQATVRSHLSNILSKLHLDNRPQAVLYALREGLASLDDGPGHVEG